MNVYLQVVLLGALQGFTEFFPVSSSGHLVLAQYFMGMQEPEIFLDLILHMGTLVAVLLFLHKEVLLIIKGLWAQGEEGQKGRRLLLMIIVATIPTALMGFGLRAQFEAMFASLSVVGCALLVTGILLLLTKLYASHKDIGLMAMPWLYAVIIGIAQGFAITPGLSRSGTTICIALLLGLNRELSFKFSFLLSIPAILGAVLLESIKMYRLPPDPAALSALPLIVGAMVAGLCGILALSLMNKLVKTGQIYGFFPYCLLLGVIALWAG